MKGNYLDFRDALKIQESGGKYDIVNRFGYLGAYQFGKARLLDLGISIGHFGRFSHPLLYKNAIKITKEEFLTNSQLQDETFRKHCIDLLKKIKIKFSNRLNSIFNGIKITESGLIAGCHLVGLGGVSLFFKGLNIVDGNKITVKSYIKKFGDYDLSELKT